MGSIRKSLYVSAIAISAGALFAGSPASAQNTVEEIVVTGSRIARPGLETPTPVASLTTEDLLQKAPSNIPDALNQLPQFRVSRNQDTGNTFNVATQSLGNYLNLRNLGTQRVLILMDGRRVPTTTARCSSM